MKALSARLPAFARFLPVLGPAPGTVFALSLITGSGPVVAEPAVQLWETNLVIPTYQVAPPDPNPRFYQGRTYQGARATFYPYPVLDRLTDDKADRTYRALFLENEHVQICVLPELGGRIFSAVDKHNGYDFFYRQHVIKPALIGMLGAWISGGVEWNVPHHHRATSFMPVDDATRAYPDGRRTVWVGETEWRHRLRWALGLTLYPDCSALEMAVTVSNPTPFPQSFLFWINPAVHATDQYQVIFPPDTEFAVQHGKPEFARWPIATQVYGGVDYTRGVDISWWKNHPSPVSFFCFQSAMDFFGGYDHGRHAGVLHVANHHVAPGKKFFEWGTGPEGQQWSQILTDADGPYLELMAGAYSDNQPDYSWIQPGETKSWQHHWYPIRELGGAKNATVEAAVNLDYTNRTARLAFQTTTTVTNAAARLLLGDRPLFETRLDLTPAKPFKTQILIEQEVAPHQLRAVLSAADGRELVAYQPLHRQPEERPLPEPARRPAPPKDIASLEELYLTGLRIEQLHSPSFEPAPYYEEVLRRDPGDYRANVALGILLAKAGRWDDAETRLRAAFDRATAHYIRPKDTEASYFLGVVLKARGRLDEARDAFYRATWDLAWQAPAFLALAEIHCHLAQFHRALDCIDRALQANSLNPRARALKSAILRHLGQPNAALAIAQQAAEANPLDFDALHELALAETLAGKTNDAHATWQQLQIRTRREPQSWLELASGYERAGLWTDAADLLERSLDGDLTTTNAHPLVFYHLGYAYEMAGRIQSLKLYRHAARLSPKLVFPFRLEEERILRRALDWNPDDARAWYYLGNLLYDHQPEAAIDAWEQSRSIQDAFALVHRNLGLAYAQTEQNPAKAVASLERAVELDPAEPRFLYELDLQYEASGAPLARRLATLTNHHATAAQRDDALTREIILLTAAGETDRALDLLARHRFHNWEGRSEIHGIYADARLQRGHARLRARQIAEAQADYTAALDYPANLQVGRPQHDRKAAQIHYYLGLAATAAGDTNQAISHFTQATARLESNPSEIQFCQALALRQLQRPDDAARIFAHLIETGQAQLNAPETQDYFAKFGERQPERVRQAQAHFLQGLGHLGQGDPTAARSAFEKALELHPAHLGAKTQLADLTPPSP